MGGPIANVIDFINTAHYDFYLRRFSEAGLVAGPLRPSVRQSVRNTLGVPSLCNL